jgi:hypothetical protein
MRTALRLAAPVLVCGSLWAAGIASAAVETVEPETCGAELAAEMLERSEEHGEIHFRFEVEIAAKETCSALTYDFMVEEMLPNKQTKTVRKPRHVALRAGQGGEVVEHSITDDLELLGYAVRLVACECGAGDS